MKSLWKLTCSNKEQVNNKEVIQVVAHRFEDTGASSIDQNDTKTGSIHRVAGRARAAQEVHASIIDC